MGSKEQLVVSLVNDPQSTYNASKLEPELLQRMDSLYAFYHKQWWCYKNMLNHFKCRNALFNGLALLLMAIGMIVGPVLENVILVTCMVTCIQKLSFQRRDESICLHHLCQNFDRVAYVCAWFATRGFGRVFSQDANLG